MKNTKGIALFLRSLMIVWLILQTQITSQKKDSLGVGISSVQIGSEQIQPSEWKKLEVPYGKSLLISYNPLGTRTEKIFYRVLLDGAMNESRLINNYFSLSNIPKGAHIIKIIPFTDSGEEGIATMLPFYVKDISEVAESGTGKEGVPFSIDLLTAILIGISFLELIIIVILFRKRGSSEKQKLEKDEVIRELSDVRQTYKRLKEELSKQKEENDHLKTKIKEMDASMVSLEKANVQLVEQKEKLASSKNKLEVLHTHKEELFAIAVHDIKNPASAIRGYIELLNSYDLNATEQHEIMTSLVASSEDIMKVSQQMCTLIAKAMPEPKLKFSKSSLKSIIDDVYLQNGSYAKAKKVKFFNKSTTDLPEVSMDAEKIEEALDNLVNNAIKYAPPETIVEIKSYIKDLNRKTVVVEVKDTGVGLSDEDLKRSFQKGAVLSAKPTGLEQSSGLGLWIVKRIIEEHDGKVWVESKQGIGSTFAFELPFD